MFRILVLLLAACSAAPALAQVVSGPATAIEGDRLSLSGIEVQLYGIDAPELAQPCRRADQPWTCGAEAKQVLADFIAGHEVTCHQRAAAASGAIIAACTAQQQDLGALMLEAGLATALPDQDADYADTEARMRGLRHGIWAATFDPPADWRRANPAKIAAAPRASVSRTKMAVRAALNPGILDRAFKGCVIKGNHSIRGDYIYHLPGMPHYNETRAEQFFCTEAQARAAGYRRAIVK